MAAAVLNFLERAASCIRFYRRSNLYQDSVLIVCLACLVHSSVGRLFDDGMPFEGELREDLGQLLPGLEGLGTGIKSHFEWTLQNVGALALACVCALLANSAGVGGGPLYMALFNGVLGFSMTASTALSNTVIASSAIASTGYGLMQPSPLDPSSTLIDFSLVLMFVPPLLVGVGVGVLLNILFPEWLQTLGLLVLLSFVVRRTWLKALQTWNAETVLRSYQPVPLPPPREEGTGTDGPESSLTPGSSEEASSIKVSAACPLRRVSKALGPLGLVAALWVGFLSCQLALGQHSRCSWQYALLWAAQTGMCLAFTVFMVRRQLASGRNEEVQSTSVLSSGGADAAAKLLKVVGAMALAGMAAGLLGIGGAVIFNPFLLALDVHPQVTASTAVMMILFSSSSVSLSFYFKGLLNTSFATFFGPACFAASLLGVAMVGRIIKRTGRASIIIFILTGLLAAGTLITFIFGGARSYDNVSHGRDIGFKPFCGR